MQVDAQQNFRIFLVPLNFIHIEELISTIAAQFENFIFFKARLKYSSLKLKGFLKHGYRARRHDSKY